MENDKSYPCRILKGNRITIPREIAKEMKVKVGGLLLLKRQGKGIYLVPCKVVEL